MFELSSEDRTQDRSDDNFYHLTQRDGLSRPCPLARPPTLLPGHTLQQSLHVSRRRFLSVGGICVVVTNVCLAVSAYVEICDTIFGANVQRRQHLVHSA